jgi:hypothetical protein
MSFLTPLYLLGGLLVGLPIVLHLLRRDVAPPLPFTAVSLLRKSAVERSRRHRLRDLILLAARVAALVLLAASFARPYVAGASPTARTTVVAVDRSYSMSAPGRRDRARALAREAIDAVARGDRVAVVAFDDRADVVAPPGTAADARAAVDAIEPGYGATRYGAAFDRAAELLANEEHGRLVIVSDLQRTGFDATGASLPEGIDLSVRDAGARISNLSVSAAGIDGTRRLATATIRNSGDEARVTDVRMVLDDRAPIARRVSVPANDAIDVAFEAAGDPRRVKMSVDDSSGYAADNDRFGVYEARGLPKVLILTGGPASTAGFYLSRALVADAGEGPDFEVRALGGAAFAGLSQNEVRDQSVIALLSTHGLDRRAGDILREYLAAGGGIFVAASADVDPTVLSTLLQWQPSLTPKDVRRPRVLAATDLRHPVFRPFDAVAANFGQVLFERAWSIDATAAWRIAAQFTDGSPALVERVQSGGRLMLFTSDVDRRWNDLPLHPTFVPFTQEIARYLGARPAAVSNMLVADVPAGSPAVPGFAAIGIRTVAVNVDPREASADRVTPIEFQKLVTRTSAGTQARVERRARETEGQQNYWRYGLMLLMATLVVEAFVGSR